MDWDLAIRLPGPIRCQQGRLQLRVRVQGARTQRPQRDGPDPLPVPFLAPILLELRPVEPAIAAAAACSRELIRVGETVP
jgi:hypothetical protein